MSEDKKVDTNKKPEERVLLEAPPRPNQTSNNGCLGMGCFGFIIVIGLIVVLFQSCFPSAQEKCEQDLNSVSSGGSFSQQWEEGKAISDFCKDK